MADAGVLALQSVSKSLRQLSRVPAQAAAAAAGKIRRLIGQQWDAEVDPYGRPWAEHKPATVERWGEHPILDLTGELRDVDVSPAPGAGIRVSLGAVPYGAFHQIGTVDMVARPPLPNNGLPDTWRRAIADAADEAAERATR